MRTLIFTDVLEGKRQASVFALDNSDFAKSTSPNNAEKAKVVQAD